MSLKDRIFSYLKERKSAFSSEEIAKYFMCSKSAAYTALSELLKEEKVSCVVLKRTRYFRVDREKNT